MPFSSLKLHPSLLKGIKELGFTRPTPIQADAIPPALAGPRRARLRHDRQRQDGGVPAADPAPADRQARAAPRARWCSRRRASWRRRSSRTSTTSRCTRRSPAAAVFGGVGMGPQEHAFRSGVDVIIATPGRLLDHFRAAVREARRPRVPGARRSRPDARHGLPARHPARAAAPPRRSGRRSSSARRCRRRSRAARRRC